MKQLLKRMVLFMAMIAGIMVFPAGVEEVMAAVTSYTSSGENNVEGQNYYNSSDVVTSYLSYDRNGGFMRVQGSRNPYNGEVLVEYYDASYHQNRSLTIPAELPQFGGFYETDTNYFLVSGQDNPDELASVEVFRVTKYDKNWNRIASVGLYDCNTVWPFYAGSLRMTTCGKYLLIRTAHGMYQGSDGKNHQANVTIQVDMQNMQITDSFTKVMNSQYGYVSHSFNQFIAVEDNRIVAVDHGDAYPRSIILIKYNTDVTNGKFTPGYKDACDTVDVMEFPGRIGDNTTGASLGGFAVTDSSYLIAGNSVIQDDLNTSRETRNIFVASVSKRTGEVTINWLTNYAEGDGTTYTPHMVKISNSEYAILWSRKNEVYYVKVDKDGKALSDIGCIPGNLSDCVPVKAGNKLVWYTCENNHITFYDINLSDGFAPIKNGLAMGADGSWHYYRNGLIDWNYTGMALNEYGWWYLRNGELDWNYTGMALNEYGWWYFRDGQLDWTYTGMALNEYGWWYFRDGQLDWTYTGMALNEYGWWYFKDGQLDWTYTGMALNEYGWWYFKDGQLDWNYTGWAENEYGRWHFTNGRLDG